VVRGVVVCDGRVKVRLGIKLPHHAYILPPNVEVSAAARVAHIQGGVLHVVSERVVEVEVVDLGGAGPDDDIGVDVDMVEVVWGPVVAGRMAVVDVRGVGVHPTSESMEHIHSSVRVCRVIGVG
jgi:hypothetical protein